MTTLNAKNILLVHPLGYRTEAAGRDISRMANIMPPLGLASIAAFLKKQGNDAAIIDYYARPDSDRLVRDYLLTEQPAFIGVSCTTSSFLDAVRIIKIAKSILPDIQAVLGGPHAKFTPFPGSPIYQNIHELGEFDEDWEKMDCMHFQFIPKGMTKEQMEELFQKFYKTHFMRPKVLLGYAAMVWRSPDSWLRFLENMGDFLRFARSNKRLGEG